MKLPLSWLRDWIEFEGTPERVADALTRRGFYVEGIETRGRSYPGVVIARVLEVAKHPNADRLSLCRVSDGAAEMRVVCGAPNVRAGMIAPLATVGAKLPGGVVIQKSKIRGEESQGMLCSARELQLSDDHDGIVDLERLFAGATLTPGQPLDSLFGPADAVLEVEVPFNRPDGLGVLGLAREVKAALGGHWTGVAEGRLKKRWSGRSDFDLELEDPEGCPRYLAVTVGGVAVGPSPRWLVERLEAAGQRAINNVVDLTNFVLLEFGQPLHAFDLDRLQGPAIRVRRARAGETLVTLDGKERTLTPEVLVIADRARPVAIAGVMGGADSEVLSLADKKTGDAGGEARAANRMPTTRLLLECAWFDPVRVRRSARALGLSTEASKRFERGVDPEVGPVATARFLSLLREIVSDAQPGAAREKVAKVRSNAPVTLRLSRLERILGSPVPPEEAARHLESLEFEVKRGDPLRITVPPWRPDVTLEDDLVEEVARARGYEKIGEAPLETGGAYAVRAPAERVRQRARTAMLARGLSEAWCTTLVSEREAADAARLLGQPATALVRLANPMSREGEALRPNLVPGLLRACAHNLRQGEAAVRLFEIGPGVLAGAGPLPDETAMIAALVTGPTWAHAHDATPATLGFEDAKGLWEAFLAEMRVDTPNWRTYSAEGWKPGASAEVVSGTSRIGWAGTLGPALLRAWDIEVPVHLFVALLDALADHRVEPAGVALPGRFPPVRRDLAFFVPQATTYRQVEDCLRASAGERLVSIELFDVYAGPGTPPGTRSLAFALQFQHPERTLTESEVQAIQDRMVQAVAKECGGRLRER
jgi:phenylalanyl-tRNA synthetase beta chain